MSCSPATAGAGAGSRRVPMATASPLEIGEPVLRWSARAHSIAEIEHELARIWSGQDLTAEVDGEPGRHVSARSSVMNLVVIARRPELAEHCAATIQALTGRHPSRTMIVGSADPDGPSWLDARVEAHCVLPREGSPETCAEMIHITAGGEAGRHVAAIVDAAADPRPPGHHLVAGRATARSGRDERHARRGRPARGGRLHVERRRARSHPRTRGPGGDRTPGRQRLRARPPVALARGDRLDLRRSGVPAVPPLPAADRGHLRHARRDGRGRVHQPGQAGLPRRLARLAIGPPRRQATRVDHRPGEVPRGRARSARPEPSRQPGAARRRSCRTVVPRCRSSSRPVLSPTPAGTTLRVELLADRRGSELRADVTAEAGSVHVRVWQDGVEALERSFRAPRLTEVDLLAQAIEGGRRDPVAAGALQAAAALAGPRGSRG